MRILIVEDYPKIGSMIAMAAMQDGHLAERAESAEAALERLKSRAFDCIVLDLMLPKMQGEELIRRIRRYSDVYIVVLSAKLETKDKVGALTLGADDYMTKPFSLEELLVKLKNLEKRLIVQKPVRRSFRQGDLIVFPMSREVFKSEQAVTLTQTEFEILDHLTHHPNVIFTRESLMEQCMNDSEAYDRVVDVFIRNIRRKIDDPEGESYIRTVYGVGYQFVGDRDA
jgi:DNA-binding response OmpR family regulator